MGDEAVVVQIIRQICDLREALAFHNDKRTDHGFFGEAPPPGCRSGQREVQTAEKPVVKHGGALGCKQRHILNDFLSVDSGQPLSGWRVSQIHFTKKGLRFLYQWSDFRLQPWPGTIAITAFLAFCSWRCYDYFVRGSYPVPAHERTSTAQATAHAKCRKCQKGLYLCGAALYNRLR